jgi:hypothetical protein
MLAVRSMHETMTFATRPGNPFVGCHEDRRRQHEAPGRVRMPNRMSETIIGYARRSTDEQDLTAQRQRLAELGVADDRIYLDHG